MEHGDEFREDTKQLTMVGKDGHMAGVEDVALSGHRVLIAEDEYLSAADLVRELEQAGAAIIGPFPTTREAMRALSDTDPTAAILDIDLRGETVFPLADALAARSIPFVFMTGHSAQVLPEHLADVPRCHKPLRARTAVRLLCRHLAKRES